MNHKINRIHGITAALSLALGGAAYAQQTNLITNPGFEESGAAWSLWKDGSASEAAAVVTYPDSGARSGTRFARVDVTVPAEENWHIQFQTPAQWDAVMGATYEMTFWARSDSSSNMHFSVQDGPDNGYTYRTGFDFGFTPEWSEYSFSYTSDVEGYGALRFFLYLGATVDTYGFDDFKLVEFPPASIKDGVASTRQALRVTREQGHFVLALENGAAVDLVNLKGGLFDARGVNVATAARRADGMLQVAAPAKAGTYFVRASAGNKVWVRQVTVR